MLNNLQNGRLANAVCFSQFSTAGRPADGPDFINLSGCQFSIPVLFTSHWWALNCSSLANPVSNIVRMGSKKQMLRSCAFRVIAFVKYARSVIGDSAMMDVPRNPRGEFGVTASSASSDLTVSKHFASGPLPAVSKFWSVGRNRPVGDDLTPESFLDRIRVSKGCKNRVGVRLGWRPSYFFIHICCHPL